MARIRHISGKERAKERAAVVLAAGLGTRMKSSLPKVLHTINGKPLVRYVVEAVSAVSPQRIVVVVSPATNDGIRKALAGLPVLFSLQKEPKGTGDALKTAARKLRDFDGTVVVVSGDTPLVTGETLETLLALHAKNREQLSMISFVAGGPHSYGRIVRAGSRVAAIVEDKDADAEQKKIDEVNSGIYAIASSLLPLLKEIRRNPVKGEYYLTDLAGIAVKKGYTVGAHSLGNERELTGINTPEELYRAGHYLRDRVLSQLLEQGVSFVDRASVYIHPSVTVGPGTLIYPNVHLEGATSVGSGCIICPNTRIVDSTIGNTVTVKDSTVIESSVVHDSAAVGPFAHLRPGSVIGASAKIGNFVEVKKSVIGEGTKASHLSYLGDAEIGKDVNIGAGAITCNYDGARKHKTTIEDGVFIGSDTQLVAPVTVGKGAYVGAGSTITKDVPPLALALSRAPQKQLENWALRKQQDRKRATARKPMKKGG